MKIKYLSILSTIVVVVFFGVSFAQASGLSYAFNQNLTIGSAGADVIALQQILINDGYLTAVSTPTGYFGYGTQVALGKFQAANGISPASGYGGAKTRAFLNTLSVPSVSQPTSAAGNQQSQPVAISNNQMCQNHYGVNSDYTGTNNTQGGLICGCESGYQWNTGDTSCVAVPTETGYQVCSNNSSNATWNGTYLSNGRYDCVCDSGYVVNSNQTGCVAQSQASIQVTSAIANYKAELQTYENEVTADQNQIATVQTEASPSCTASEAPFTMSNLLGTAGAQLNAEAQECTSYEQEISGIAQQEKLAEQAETSAQNEIFYLESLPTAQ